MSRWRDLLAVLVSRSTWRRFMFLLIGAALLAPYGMLASFLGEAIEGAVGIAATWLVVSVVCFVALPIATGMLAPVREVERAAARRLLGAQIGEADPVHGAQAWSTRWRSAAWFVGHLVVGGAVGALTLVLPPAMLSALYAPFGSGDVPLGQLDLTIPGGAQSAWVVPLALLSPVALVLVAASAGALQALLAPRLLGPSQAERLVSLERHAARLAERNRLARELHDSVGHALSIVTVQAGAAGHVLDRDPEFARQALAEIATSARDGLRDLDHVLALLRDDAPARAPTPTLADLRRLVESTRSAGIDVSAELTGSIDAVPQAVSREAYRIVQESLTNAVRHGADAPVTLSVNVGPEHLELELTNPLNGTAATRGGGGRGLPGIRERVSSLQGRVAAGPEAGRWRIVARLPLRPT